MSKKFKILSIDDSKAVHAFLKDCSSELALSFSSVFNGAEAIELLTNNINQFDVIFLDWEMPIKDGPTTFNELKKLGLKTPVFMLTSKNNPEDIMKMIEAGVMDYLMKPFTKEIIQEKILQNLG